MHTVPPVLESLGQGVSFVASVADRMSPDASERLKSSTFDFFSPSSHTSQVVEQMHQSERVQRFKNSAARVHVSGESSQSLGHGINCFAVYLMHVSVYVLHRIQNKQPLSDQSVNVEP